MDNEKINSAITSVNLNEATFQNQKFAPTYINFIFGNNGTGKSTIAKVINNKFGLTWDIGKDPSNYDVLVYNEEFIKSNIASYENMPGVFTISKQNADIQDKIQEYTSLQNKTSDELKKAYTELSDAEAKLKKENNLFSNNCWEKTRGFREKVIKATGKGTKDKLVSSLLEETEPKEYDENSLIAMCDAAFNNDAMTYPELSTINKSNIPTCPLLGKKIISSNNSLFSDFMQKIGATNWVKQGHDIFHDKSDGKCPYCQRKLDDGFENEIAKCFDSEYESDINTIKSFNSTYTNEKEAISRIISTNLTNSYTAIQHDLEEYKTSSETLMSKFALNEKIIEQKISTPDEAVELEDVNTIIDNLNTLANKINAEIRKNNDIVSNQKTKQPECRKAINQYLAYILKYDIDSYRQTRTSINEEIGNAKKKSTEIKNKLDDIKNTISTLKSQVVNTIDAIHRINAILNDTGFQGFYIREKQNKPNFYEVVRTQTGEVAQNLSEGERNFIAFLYFYQLVLGSKQEENNSNEKIVVIDDPVSSMDSSSLFVIGNLIREMIEICNPDFETEEYNSSDIKQIFILTHNVFFHQDVTFGYDKPEYYQYVSFFEISKVDNNSSIKLCTKTINSIEENYNPIQNSYAALWDTYREVNSPNILVNTIRQILNYYFLQLCGYNGRDIKDKILKENRNNFITQKPDGTEDATNLHIVSSLLQYLSTSNDSISDGLNFIPTSINVDSCRAVFKDIFTLMRQGQHYDMMMKKN